MAVELAPDREMTVRRVCFDHPEVFRGPVEQSDDRRRAFLPTIVRALNAIDHGEWGVLTKTDQGNKVPADFIVWRPTLQGFDVMTDRGATWIPRGTVDNPRWIWTPVDDLPGTPPATDAPAWAVVADQLTELRELLELMAVDRATLHQKIDVLINRPPAAAPTYRTSLFGVTVVLRPDPLRSPIQ